MAVNEHGASPGPDEADERIARLYKEAAREEPPARLDRAIAAAARERPAGAAAAGTPWWLRWRVPFAFAAVAVVSVSLVTLMVEEDRERIIALPPAAPPPAAREPLRDPPAAPLERETVRRESKVERKPAAAPLRKDAARPEPDAVRERKAEVEKPGVAERREAASATADARMMQRSAPEPAREIAQEGALGAAGASPAVARHVAELDREPLAAWIDRVIALRKDGRLAEADSVLAELKRRYPDATLPVELR